MPRVWSRLTKPTRSSARRSRLISSPCFGAGTGSGRIRSGAAGRSSTSSCRRRPSRSSSSTARTSHPSMSGSSFRSKISLPEQVARLNALHPQPLRDADIQRLYALIRGHPYLTRKALYVLASSTPACGDRGTLRAGHRRRWALWRSPAVLPAAAPGQARADFRASPGGRAAQWRRRAAHHRLQAAGLVRREGKNVVPRCELYAAVFPRAPP